MIVNPSKLEMNVRPNKGEICERNYVFFSFVFVVWHSLWDKYIKQFIYDSYWKSIWQVLQIQLMTVMCQMSLWPHLCSSASREIMGVWDKYSTCKSITTINSNSILIWQPLRRLSFLSKTCRRPPNSHSIYMPLMRRERVIP